MAWQVVLANSAKADAGAIYDWVVAKSPVNGPAWFEELIDCLYSLEEMPFRCSLAREASEARREIRCLRFGRRQHVYRILYQIEEPRKMVWILHIRHGALRDLTADELSVPGTSSPAEM